MSETKRRAGTCRAVRHGAGGLRFRHQRARHRGRPARWRRCSACRPGITRIAVPPLVRTEARLLSPARRAELDRFTAACRDRARIRRHGAADCSTTCCRAARRQAERRSRRRLDDAARSLRLRRRAARADPGRSARRPHRPGAESPARQHRHRRRRSRTTLVDAARRTAGALSRRSAWRRWRRARRGGVAGRRHSARRWTKGAGVVKALNPFCRLGGRHRSFIEVHLAKSRRASRECGALLPHVFTTSYLTHDAIAEPSARARKLRLSRPAAAFARPQHRPAHGSHGARPALRLGGNAAAVARRAGAKGAREPARHADRMGAPGRRRQRLHRQSAAAVPASGGPLVRDSQPAAQRHAGASCWRIIRG